MNLPQEKVSPAQVKELWEDYRNGRAKGNGMVARTRLIENYLPKAISAAKSIYRDLPEEVELDDLISDGVCGLIDAIKSFDETRGVRFTTHAYSRIRGEILNGLGSMDFARNARTRSNKYNQAVDVLRDESGRFPTDAKLRKELGVSNKQFELFKIDACPARLISLDEEKFGGRSGEVVRGIDVLAGKEYRDCREGYKGEVLAGEDNTDYREVVERKDFVRDMISKLSPEERFIIYMRYVKGETLTKIGKRIGLGRAAVSLIHIRIISEARTGKFSGIHTHLKRRNKIVKNLSKIQIEW